MIAFIESVYYKGDGEVIVFIVGLIKPCISKQFSGELRTSSIKDYDSSGKLLMFESSYLNDLEEWFQTEECWH